MLGSCGELLPLHRLFHFQWLLLRSGGFATDGVCLLDGVGGSMVVVVVVLT